MSDKRIRRKPGESLLDWAARLVWIERENLTDSAPRGILARLERIADELEEIENRL